LESSNETMIQNTIHVLVSSLEFILFLEGQNMVFTNQINIGIKLYHLFNTLLDQEEILQKKIISCYFMELFHLFTKQINPINFKVMKGFFSACYQHSSLSIKGHLAKDKQSRYDILSLLNPTSPFDNLNSDELKTIDDFVADLSSAFLEYGALYGPFIHAFRFLLRPWFTTKLRRITIRKITDLLQRLTTIQEDEDVFFSLLTQAIADNISGGLLISQEAPRNSYDFLDVFFFSERNWVT